MIIVELIVRQKYILKNQYDYILSEIHHMS
jgi:hypothetical protein